MASSCYQRFIITENKFNPEIVAWKVWKNVGKQLRGSAFSMKNVLYLPMNEPIKPIKFLISLKILEEAGYKNIRGNRL